MDRLSELRSIAHNRAVELKTPYAGSFTPKEANEALTLATKTLSGESIEHSPKHC